MDITKFITYDAVLDILNGSTREEQFVIILYLIDKYPGDKNELFENIEITRQKHNLQHWYISEFEDYVDDHLLGNNERIQYVIKQLERLVNKDK